jgi:hypothetical protein
LTKEDKEFPIGSSGFAFEEADRFKLSGVKLKGSFCIDWISDESNAIQPIVPVERLCKEDFGDQIDYLCMHNLRKTVSNRKQIQTNSCSSRSSCSYLISGSDLGFSNPFTIRISG